MSSSSVVVSPFPESPQPSLTRRDKEEVVVEVEGEGEREGDSGSTFVNWFPIGKHPSPHKTLRKGWGKGSIFG